MNFKSVVEEVPFQIKDYKELAYQLLGTIFFFFFGISTFVENKQINKKKCKLDITSLCHCFHELIFTALERCMYIMSGN